MAPIPESEIISAAERIIREAGMAEGSNPARLLRYVVSETLAGRADRLKAFTIGQDVLQRGAGFDPSTDSIVRVEMKRLRENLEHYYATIGAAQPVRISITKGSYVPSFSRHATIVDGSEPTVAHRPKRTALLGGLLTRGVGAAAALVGAAAFAWSMVGEPIPDGEGEPRLQVVSDDERSNTTYGEAVSVLSRFRNFELVTNAAPGDLASPRDYLLTFSPGDGGTLVQLSVPATGQVLTSQVFAASDLAVPSQGDSLSAFQVWLGRAASRNGVIETNYVKRGVYSGDFACSVLTETYFSDQTDDNHRAARDCILDRLESGLTSARLQTDLALLFREEESDQRNLMPGDPLERAKRAAFAAIALDRFDANAYYALMTVHFASGAFSEGISMGERSLDLNPFDGEAVGGFAARLNYIGEHKRSLELFDLSRQLTPGGVTWRDYGYFLAYLGLNQLEAAASIGIGLRGLDNELYLAAVAISALIGGDLDLARETKAALLQEEPDLRWMFERRAYAPELVDKLMEQLDEIQVD